MKDLKEFLSPDSIFSLTDTDLMGKPNGKIISSYQFIRDGIKILINLSVDKNYSQYLFEYSQILKELVKQELLDKMREGINNIDTFYR